MPLPSIFDEPSVRTQLGCNIPIVREGKTWYARGYNPSKGLALTGREVEAICPNSPGNTYQLAKLQRNLIYSGVRLGTPFDDNNRVIIEFVDGVKSRLAPGRSVLLDTTTFLNAWHCVERRDPWYPTQLLDLSALCYAALFYDNIILLTHPRHPLSPNSPHQSFGFIKTEICSEEIYNTLVGRIVHDNDSERRDFNNRQWTQIWQTHYGDNALRIDLFKHYDELTDSPDAQAFFLVEALSRGEQIWFTEGDPRPRASQTHDLGAMLSIQTGRALICDSLAGLLNIPYVATAIRSPVHNVLIGAKARIFAEIENAIADMAMPAPLVRSQINLDDRMSAPFPLALVLANSSQLDRFWHTLKDIRKNWRELRTAIATMEEQQALYLEGNAGRDWQHLTEGFLETYRDWINRSFRDDLVQRFGAVGADLAPGVLTSASGHYGSVAQLVIKLLTIAIRPADIGLTLSRIFRPGISVVIESRIQCQRVMDLRREIERFWGSACAASVMQILPHYHAPGVLTPRRLP